jgi:hypothetical protein
MQKPVTRQVYRNEIKLRGWIPVRSRKGGLTKAYLGTDDRDKPVFLNPTQVKTVKVLENEAPNLGHREEPDVSTYGL